MEIKQNVLRAGSTVALVSVFGTIGLSTARAADHPQHSIVSNANISMVSQTPNVSYAVTSTARKSLISDKESIDRLATFERDLESMPTALLNADPKTYPNYEKEISKYFTNLTPTTATIHHVGVANPQFSAWRCLIAIAGIVANAGIPGLEVLNWIREAKVLWGGYRGILYAIQSGIAATEIGGQAAQVLLQVIGIGPCL